MQEKIPGFLYLKIFVLIFVVLVVGSIIFRALTEVVDSTFTNNSYLVLVSAKDSKLIYVDKKNKTGVYVSLGDLRQFVKGKNPLGASISLGIPINALIWDEKVPRTLDEFTSSSYQTRLLFDPSIKYKNINKLDIFRLTSALKSTPKDNRVEARVNIFDQKELKEKLGDNLKDSVITNMQYTVEIDNGTSINGLGNTLAFILSRQGYNIISVRTSSEKGNSYISFNGSKNVYINSLISLLGFDFMDKSVSQAADVTIYLGDELEAMLSP